jgi:hypothetical protein
MFCRASRRFSTAFVVVLSLLFSQLALANYICPTGSAGEQPAMMEMAPGEPCEGMGSDAEQPALCHQHCVNAAQSFDAIKLPTVSLPAVVQVLLVPLALDAAAQEAFGATSRVRPQPPPEPVFLSTLRLRV